MEKLFETIKENKKTIGIISAILVILLGVFICYDIFKNKKEEEKIIHYKEATIYKGTYTYGVKDTIYIENVEVNLKIEEQELIAEYNNGDEMITLDISGIEGNVKYFTYYNNYYLEVIAVTEDGSLYGWSESPSWDWKHLYQAEMEFKKVNSIDSVMDVTILDEKDKATNNSKKLCVKTKGDILKVVDFRRDEQGELEAISVGKTYEQNYPWIDSMQMNIQYITSNIYIYPDKRVSLSPSANFITDERKQYIHAKAVYMQTLCKNGNDLSQCEEDDYASFIYIVTTNHKLYLLINGLTGINVVAKPVNGKDIKSFSPTKVGHYERKEIGDTGNLTQLETPVIIFDDNTKMYLNIDQYYIISK